MKKYLIALFAAVLALFANACMSVENNDRSIRELANHMMISTGAVWDGPWVVDPLRAESGFALKLNDRQVVFLKYNTDREKQRKKLDYVDRNGCLYIYAFKFPAMRHGSFVMMDYEAFPPETKEKLIKAFKSFGK